MGQLGKAVLNEQQREQLRNQLMCGEKIDDLVKQYGISRSSVYHYKKGLGLVKSVGKVACPKCGNTIHLLGAKFCQNCGESLKSRKQILVEGLQDALTLIISYAPKRDKDRCAKAVRDAIRLVKDDQANTFEGGKMDI